MIFGRVSREEPSLAQLKVIVIVRTLNMLRCGKLAHIGSYWVMVINPLVGIYNDIYICICICIHISIIRIPILGWMSIPYIPRFPRCIRRGWIGLDGNDDRPLVIRTAEALQIKGSRNKDRMGHKYGT